MNDPVIVDQKRHTWDFGKQDDRLRLGWHGQETADRFHVLPVNDLRDHEETAECWCNPRIAEHLVIHNSLDRREIFEDLAVQ